MNRLLPYLYSKLFRFHLDLVSLPVTQPLDLLSRLLVLIPVCSTKTFSQTSVSSVIHTCIVQSKSVTLRHSHSGTRGPSRLRPASRTLSPPRPPTYLFRDDEDTPCVVEDEGRSPILLLSHSFSCQLPLSCVLLNRPYFSSYLSSPFSRLVSPCLGLCRSDSDPSFRCSCCTRFRRFSGLPAGDTRRCFMTHGKDSPLTPRRTDYLSFYFLDGPVLRLVWESHSSCQSLDPRPSPLPVPVSARVPS